MSRKLLTCLQLVRSSAGLGAGEISKALWSRNGSRLLRRSRSGVPPFTPYIVLFIAFIYLRNISNGTVTLMGMNLVSGL